MGGLVALTAAGMYGDEFAAVIGIDVPEEAVRQRRIPRPEDRPERPALGSKGEILARFRTQPPDPARKPYIVEYVGNHSVRRQPHGWVWKFDHGVYFHGHFERHHLAEARCEVSLIVAERSLLTDDEVRQLCGVLESARGATVTVTRVPDCGHHIMLDQPLALVHAIREHVTKSRPAFRDEGDSCYYAHSSYS
jgi:pimeloyl-ACP methyl ester carboxylesterase